MANFTNGEQFVYVLREGTAGIYKIGKTSGVAADNYRNVQRRMSNLQQGNPRELHYQCNNGNFMNGNLWRVNDNQVFLAETTARGAVTNNQNFQAIPIQGVATEWVYSPGGACPCAIVNHALAPFIPAQ